MCPPDGSSCNVKGGAMVVRYGCDCWNCWEIDGDLSTIWGSSWRQQKEVTLKTVILSVTLLSTMINLSYIMSHNIPCNIWPQPATVECRMALVKESTLWIEGKAFHLLHLAGAFDTSLSSLIQKQNAVLGLRLNLSQTLHLNDHILFPSHAHTHTHTQTHTQTHARTHAYWPTKTAICLKICLKVCISKTVKAVLYKQFIKTVMFMSILCPVSVYPMLKKMMY